MLPLFVGIYQTEKHGVTQPERSQMLGSDDNPPDYKEWLFEILPQYERLTAGVRSLLENMLKKNNIEFLSVNGRTKKLDGALEKIQRKEYNDPEQQLTDLSGIRVITYLEEQVSQISTIVRSLFDVDKANSLDRTEILGDDKVGYRSTHFVCTLGKKRGELPEYERLGDLKFEIQVRTVLQHAWAELAHDRSFKFGAALPPKIQRKLNLYAGMLEIVDASFDEISREIDSYKKSLDAKSIAEIADADINSISLVKFVEDTRRKLKLKAKFSELRPSDFAPLVQELENAGIRKVGDLEKRVTPEYVEAMSQNPKTAIGFVRSILLFDDPTYIRFMPLASWISRRSYDAIEKKHGTAAVKKAFARLLVSESPTDAEVQKLWRTAKRRARSAARRDSSKGERSKRSPD